MECAKKTGCCSCSQSAALYQVTFDGIQKKSVPNKVYLFLFTVRRSEGPEYSIAKRYSEFVRFNGELIKWAQLESNHVHFDAITTELPKLKCKKANKENHRLANKRKQHVIDYCNVLFCLDEHVRQSEPMQAFFQEKTSNEEIEISSPIILPSYRTTSQYTADDRRGISLEANIIVRVIQKCDTGWWLVEHVFGAKGWFPATFLEPLHPGYTDNDSYQPLEAVEKYETVKEYTARNSDEISFTNGVIVYVHSKRMDGWWQVEFESQSGLAPAVYLKACNPESESNMPCICHETQDLAITERISLEGDSSQDELDETSSSGRDSPSEDDQSSWSCPIYSSQDEGIDSGYHVNDAFVKDTATGLDELHELQSDVSGSQQNKNFLKMHF